MPADGQAQCGCKGRVFDKLSSTGIPRCGAIFPTGSPRLDFARRRPPTMPPPAHSRSEHSAVVRRRGEPAGPSRPPSDHGKKVTTNVQHAQGPLSGDLRLIVAVRPGILGCATRLSPDRVGTLTECSSNAEQAAATSGGTRKLPRELSARASAGPWFQTAQSS